LIDSITYKKRETRSILEIAEVWQKGIKIPDYSPDIWRLDGFGGLIKYSEYSNTNSQYGWKIENENPVSNGGNLTDEVLKPLNRDNKTTIKA
jgi:hypothetical protein